MTSVFDVLTRDHQQVKAMLAELEAGRPTVGVSSDQLAQRKREVQRLVIEESRHEAAEQLHFWPAVRERLPDGDVLAETALRQEQAGEAVLDQLERLDATDPEFEMMLASFTQDAREHISYEEDRVWPRLAAVLTAEQAAELGAKVEKAKKSAPTRPHPGVPPQPGPLKATGPLAAAADKLRDLVTGRGRR